MSVSVGSTTNNRVTLKLPRAILFDMDGTLTQPLLDFDQMRRDMGIGSGPILETLKRMPSAEKIAAAKVLYDHEDRAAKASTLNSGCKELLAWVGKRQIASALVTRNTRQSVKTVFAQHGLHFDVCITREDGKYKPDPDPLQLACRRLKVEIADAWMVGDGSHDIEAAVAAQMTSIWVSHGTKPTFAAKPTQVVQNLIELLQLLETISMK